MSRTRIYGTPQSRALRSIWAAEEVGIDYELVPTDFGAGCKTPEYLAINPNGRIPAMVDGDLVLFESMAINLHLARKYGKDLWPADDADQARCIQWSFWGMTELEPPLIEIFLHQTMLPEPERDPARVTAGVQALERPLPVLDAHLAKREHLLGGGFTIADLNVASVLAMVNFIGLDISAHANVSRWLRSCASRPALARAQKAGS